MKVYLLIVNSLNRLISFLNLYYSAENYSTVRKFADGETLIRDLGYGRGIIYTEYKLSAILYGMSANCSITNAEI